MAQAEIRKTLSVDKDTFFKAVTHYEDYPKFVDNCSAVKVERKGAGRARVQYQLSIMGQNISYTLDHEEDPVAGTVRWSLVESEFMRKNTGSWSIQAAGTGKCDVHYAIEIDFKIPVPGFILNRLVKGNLPSMIESFEKRARGL